MTIKMTRQAFQAAQRESPTRKTPLRRDQMCKKTQAMSPKQLHQDKTPIAHQMLRDLHRRQDQGIPSHPRRKRWRSFRRHLSSVSQMSLNYVSTSILDHGMRADQARLPRLLLRSTELRSHSPNTHGDFQGAQPLATCHLGNRVQCQSYSISRP